MPTAVRNTFAYNGDGQRVQRQDSSGTSRQIWDGQKILEETDQSNVVQVVYTQSSGVYGDVVCQRRSGTSYYYLFEPVGSTRCLTNASAAVTDNYLYKAFGETLISGATTNPFQYVGRLGYYLNEDLTTTFLRSRDYQPTQARFLSVDVFWAHTGDIHDYTYARPNPIVYVDPSGNVTIDPCHQKCCVVNLSICSGGLAGNDVVGNDFVWEGRNHFIAEFANACGCKCYCCALEVWVRGFNREFYKNGTTKDDPPILPGSGDPLNEIDWGQDSPRFMGDGCLVDQTDFPSLVIDRGRLGREFSVLGLIKRQEFLEFEARILDLCSPATDWVLVRTFTWDLQVTLVNGELKIDLKTTLPDCKDGQNAAND